MQKVDIYEFPADSPPRQRRGPTQSPPANHRSTRSKAAAVGNGAISTGLSRNKPCSPPPQERHRSFGTPVIATPANLATPMAVGFARAPPSTPMDATAGMMMSVGTFEVLERDDDSVPENTVPPEHVGGMSSDEGENSVCTARPFTAHHVPPPRPGTHAHHTAEAKLDSLPEHKRALGSRLQDRKTHTEKTLEGYSEGGAVFPGSCPEPSNSRARHHHTTTTTTTNNTSTSTSTTNNNNYNYTPGKTGFASTTSISATATGRNAASTARRQSKNTDSDILPPAPAPDSDWTHTTPVNSPPRVSMTLLPGVLAAAHPPSIKQRRFRMVGRAAGAGKVAPSTATGSRRTHTSAQSARSSRSSRKKKSKRDAGSARRGSKSSGGSGRRVTARPPPPPPALDEPVGQSIMHEYIAKSGYAHRHRTPAHTRRAGPEDAANNTLATPRATLTRRPVRRKGKRRLSTSGLSATVNYAAPVHVDTSLRVPRRGADRTHGAGSAGRSSGTDVTVHAAHRQCVPRPVSVQPRCYPRLFPAPQVTLAALQAAAGSPDHLRAFIAQSMDALYTLSGRLSAGAVGSRTVRDRLFALPLRAPALDKVLLTSDGGVHFPKPDGSYPHAPWFSKSNPTQHFRLQLSDTVGGRAPDQYFFREKHHVPELIFTPESRSSTNMKGPFVYGSHNPEETGTQLGEYVKVLEEAEVAAARLETERQILRTELFEDMCRRQAIVQPAQRALCGPTGPSPPLASHCSLSTPKWNGAGSQSHSPRTPAAVSTAGLLKQPWPNTTNTLGATPRQHSRTHGCAGPSTLAGTTPPPFPWYNPECPVCVEIRDCPECVPDLRESCEFCPKPSAVRAYAQRFHTVTLDSADACNTVYPSSTNTTPSVHEGTGLPVGSPSVGRVRSRRIRSKRRAPVSSAEKPQGGQAVRGGSASRRRPTPVLQRIRSSRYHRVVRSETSGPINTGDTFNSMLSSRPGQSSTLFRSIQSQRSTRRHFLSRMGSPLRHQRVHKSALGKRVRARGSRSVSVTRRASKSRSTRARPKSAMSVKYANCAQFWEAVDEAERSVVADARNTYLQPGGAEDQTEEKKDGRLGGGKDTEGDEGEKKVRKCAEKEASGKLVSHGVAVGVEVCDDADGRVAEGGHRTTTKTTVATPINNDNSITNDGHHDAQRNVELAAPTPLRVATDLLSHSPLIGAPEADNKQPPAMPEEAATDCLALPHTPLPSHMLQSENTATPHTPVASRQTAVAPACVSQDMLSPRSRPAVKYRLTSAEEVNRDAELGRGAVFVSPKEGVVHISSYYSPLLPKREQLRACLSEFGGGKDGRGNQDAMHNAGGGGGGVGMNYDPSHYQGRVLMQPVPPRTTRSYNNNSKNHNNCSDVPTTNATPSPRTKADNASSRQARARDTAGPPSATPSHSTADTCAPLDIGADYARLLGPLPAAAPEVTSDPRRIFGTEHMHLARFLHPRVLIPPGVYIAENTKRKGQCSLCSCRWSDMTFFEHMESDQHVIAEAHQEKSLAFRHWEDLYKHAHKQLSVHLKMCDFYERVRERRVCHCDGDAPSSRTGRDGTKCAYDVLSTDGGGKGVSDAGASDVVTLDLMRQHPHEWDDSDFYADEASEYTDSESCSDSDSDARRESDKSSDKSIDKQGDKLMDNPNDRQSDKPSDNHTADLSPVIDSPSSPARHRTRRRRFLRVKRSVAPASTVSSQQPKDVSSQSPSNDHAFTFDEGPKDKPDEALQDQHNLKTQDDMEKQAGLRKQGARKSRDDMKKQDGAKQQVNVKKQVIGKRGIIASRQSPESARDLEEERDRPMGRRCSTRLRRARRR